MKPFELQRWNRGLLALAVLVPFLSIRGYVGREHDDALYVLAAQSLAAGTYSHWHLPGRPPITVVTPGLPALLLPAAWAAPFHLAAYQILSTVYLCGAAALLFLWLRRRRTETESLLLTALFALNPLTLSRAGAVMPEGPALLAALAALMAWDDERPLLAGLLAAAAVLIRPASLTLVAALAADGLRRKNVRAALGGAAPGLLAFALWSLWCSRAGGLSEAGELSAGYAPGFLAVLARTAAANGRAALQTWGSTFLPPAVGGLASTLLGAGLVAAAAAGLWKERKGADAGDLFLLFTGAMHLAWPWWYDRYLLLMLPFLLRRAADAGIPLRWKNAALIAVAALQFLAQGRLWTGGGSGLENPPHGAAYAWIQKNLPPSTLLASPFPARDALYTGRIFLPLPPATETDDGLDRIGARCVLWEDVSDLGFSSPDDPRARAVAAWTPRLADAARYHLLFTDGDARVYEKAMPPPAAPGRPRRS